MGQDGGLDGNTEVHLCFSYSVEDRSPHVWNQEDGGRKYFPHPLGTVILHILQVTRYRSCRQARTGVCVSLNTTFN